MRRKENGFYCYEDLYKLEYLPIYKYVRRMIHEDEYAAEDLTQEVFLVAFQKWESDVRDHPNAPGFLMTVAQNKLKKWYEKNNRLFVDETEVIDAIESTSFEESTNVFKSVEFYATLEKYLSVEELELLRYYYEYNYTSSEMAEMLHVSESCFRMRMTRMRNKLKKCLGIIDMLLIFIFFYI